MSIARLGVSLMLLASLGGCGGAREDAPKVVAVAASAAVPLPPPPKPRYVLQSEGRYGYERQLSEEERSSGTVAAPVVLFAYQGLHGGAHQIMPMTDQDLRSGGPAQLVTFEWVPGAEFVKRSIYVRGAFREKAFIRATPGSLVMAAMQDAQAGFLTRYVHKHTSSGKWGYVFCDEKRGCAAEPMGVQ